MKLYWVDKFKGSFLSRLICKILVPVDFLMMYYLWENSKALNSTCDSDEVQMFGFKDYQLSLWKHLSCALWMLGNVKHWNKTYEIWELIFEPAKVLKKIYNHQENVTAVQETAKERIRKVNRWLQFCFLLCQRQGYSDKKDWDRLIKGTEFPERGDMGIKAVLKEFVFWAKQITSQAIGRFAGELKQPLSIIWGTHRKWVTRRTKDGQVSWFSGNTINFPTSPPLTMNSWVWHQS